MFAFRNDPGTDGVGVAFTDRHGGVSRGGFASLNLGRTDEDALADVAQNFDRVAAELGVASLYVVHQVHGTQVVVAAAEELASWGPKSALGDAVPGQPRIDVADAIVTAETGVALCVRVADCLPVVLADPASRVIGVAHAGREGLAAGVLPETVEAMRRAGAEQIAAWIGPHICGRCYEVGDDVAERVGRRLPEAVAKTAWGTTSLDLGAAAIAQLEALECSLRWVGPCTRTSPDLFSHRRDGAQAGRQAGLAWLT